MIHARFRSVYSDEETLATFEGPDEEAAWNILATRFSTLEYDIFTWDGVKWIELGEEEA